jgi:hypothetical protein
MANVTNIFNYLDCLLIMQYKIGTFILSIRRGKAIKILVVDIFIQTLGLGSLGWQQILWHNTELFIASRQFSGGKQNL